MINVEKPRQQDLKKIEDILTQWTDKEEVDKYIKRIKNEINGSVEFNTRYWVATKNNEVLGVSGLSDPLPKILPFTKTDKPVEIKILYIDGQKQGKGVGRALVEFIEIEARKNGYKEVLVRTAKRYKFTAWGFYKKMGYAEVGELSGNDEKEMMQVFEKILI
jgi:GNAT superfamily N-acetyltransferase